MLISIKGQGNMNNSHAIYNFVQKVKSKGIEDICIDMHSCSSMDSTFMGTLMLMHEESSTDSSHMYLINVSPANREKLVELGLDEFLDINQQRELPNLEFKKLEVDEDLELRMQLILKAHEELIHRNDKNKIKFDSFVKSLRDSFK